IDIFVLKQLADIDVGLGLGQPKLLHVAHALIQNALIDIAERGDFRSGNMRKAMEVVVATASQSANRNANTIVCAEHTSAEGERRRPNGDCFPSCLKKIPAIDRHMSAPQLESARKPHSIT